MVTRTLELPDGETIDLTLDGEAIDAFRAATRSRLRMTPAEVSSAQRELEAAASEVEPHIDYLPPAAARLEALHLVGTGALDVNSVPTSVSESHAQLVNRYGPSRLNDLSTLGQLDEWSRFFRSSSDEDLRAFAQLRLLSSDSDVNFFLAETVVGLER